MKAENDKYTVTWQAESCCENFGTMEVVDNLTNRLRIFSGVLRRSTQKDLLRAADFYMERR